MIKKKTNEDEIKIKFQFHKLYQNKINNKKTKSNKKEREVQGLIWKIKRDGKNIKEKKEGKKWLVAQN